MFLTLRQIQQELALSPAATYRLVHSGELPAHKFGGALRVSRKDLETFIEKSRMKFRGRRRQDYGHLRVLQ